LETGRSSKMPLTTDTLPPSVQTPDELSKLTVIKLKLFLKARGVRCTGKKEELLKLCRLYFDRPVLQADGTEQDVPAPPTYLNSLTFTDLSKEKGPKIPASFAIDKIVTYLSTMTASLSCVDSSDDESADAGTKKPVVKGRRMYNSEKLGMCESAVQSNGAILFRANCDASLRRQVCRYPQVTVDTNGDIAGAQCTCEASSDGRCCHIAAVLYLVEDISLGSRPKVRTATTSVQQYWGKGKVAGKDPMPVYAGHYGKKLRTDRYVGFNPSMSKPQDVQKTNDDFLHACQSLPHQTMWAKILHFGYSGKYGNSRKKF
jgi:hypothetical protein